jgi:hypothetical protein
MRTLLLCLLCAAFVAAAIKDCDDPAKRLKHALGGLGMALFFWWLLAYQIGVFSSR